MPRGAQLPLSAEARLALAGDLGRGGYLRGAYALAPRWFQTDLVLTRPGVLDRCATLLAAAVPDDADRLAARGACAVALATAIALQTGALLLLGEGFAGDAFPGARVVLIEDVLLTGASARASAAVLAAAGLDVQGVLGVLDREQGAAAALAADGLTLTTLFTETELLG